VLEGISIKEAEPADIEIVKAIEVECGLSSWTLKDYQLETSRPDSLFFIANVNAEPAGFILARLIMTSNKIPSENGIEIYNIAVKKSFRQKKAGSSLLGKLVEKAKENSVSKMYLEVRKSNVEALSLYQKNGFEIIGERRNFYTNPSEDALLMRRILRD